jgi:hypothetical protein
VFGEALARLYADKYELEVCCLRIGTVQPVPSDKRRLSLWLGPRDLAQLVSIGVEHSAIKFEIMYGVSGQQAELLRQRERGPLRLSPPRRLRALRQAGARTRETEPGRASGRDLSGRHLHRDREIAEPGAACQQSSG